MIGIIDLFHAAHDLAQVNAYLQILSKKHGQLRQAVQKMVERAMEMVQESTGKEKLDLIETLRDISEGKVRFSRGWSLYLAARETAHAHLALPACCRSTSKSPARASPGSSLRSRNKPATSTRLQN